jgi:hypothetical protein
MQFDATPKTMKLFFVERTCRWSMKARHRRKARCQAARLPEWLNRPPDAGSSPPRMVVGQRCERMGDGPANVRLDKRELLAELVFSCTVLDESIDHRA